MEELGSDKAAVVTVEELLPFPEARIGTEVLSRVSKDCQVYWVQEEPSNQGAFAYAAPHLNRLLSQHGLSPLTYVGRKAIAAVAQGSKIGHEREVAQLSAAITRILS